MYLSFKDKAGKTLWTHSSLVSDDRAQAAAKLIHGQSGFQNKFAFISTYVSLELVNRVAALKKQPFTVRAGAVAATALTSFVLGGGLYRSSIQNDLKKQLDGAPVWENKYEVPELDKKFFFLDDDNKYQPSLWHHGITHIERPKKFFRYEN